MKRLLIAFALTLLPLAAFGQVDRDVLLTSDGTLYTVESLFATPDVKVSSTRYLTLTVQNGGETKSEIVPASSTGGSHVEPSLAYDSDTKTLFLFWEAARAGAFATDLAFTYYRDGKWGGLTTLDGADWDLRSNLRIAVTRKTQMAADENGHTSIAETTVHAVWWEMGRTSSWARYAMITFDHGDVIVDAVQNLTDFVDVPASVLDSPSKREVLSHPSIFEAPTHDSVDVVFGDPRTDKLHRVTLQPTIQAGRIRIPIGRGRVMPTPTVAVAADTQISAIGASNGTDDMAYYFSTPESVKYMLYKDGKWTSLRTIALNEKLSGDAAVAALQRLVRSE